MDAEEADVRRYCAAVALFLRALRQAPRRARRLRGRLRARLAALPGALPPSPPAPLLACALDRLGALLHRRGLHRAALAHFERAAPSLVDAERNRDSLRNLLVERWHFRMLNDRVRNDGYRRALLEATPAGARALDLGTGTGLLALYALAAGARRVLAVDRAPAMCRVARAVCRGRAVTVVCAPAERLRLPPAERCQLLVTETFDAALVGERALATIAHAWDALLAPGARVVPARAELFVAGASSARLAARHRLGEEAARALGLPRDVRVGAREPYDCEDADRVPGLAFVTEPSSLLAVDFEDAADVRRHAARRRPYDVELRPTRDARVDVVVAWFELRLSASVSITTDPRAPGRATAWQHAVFADFAPMDARAGLPLRLRFTLDDGRLALAPRGPPPERASAETIRFLNDVEYVRAAAACAGPALARLAPAVSAADVRVADLSPFPAFGLAMLERGARSLAWRAGDAVDRRFVRRWVRARFGSAARLRAPAAGAWERSAAARASYHAVYAHAPEPGGDVDGARARAGAALSARLAAGGVSLPAALRLSARLVRCSRLAADAAVSDRNLCGVEAAAHVNRYAVGRVRGAAACAACEARSATASLGAPGGGDRRARVAAAGGRVDAILCRFEVEPWAGAPPPRPEREDRFADGMLFLTGETLAVGEVVEIVRHDDSEGSFKLTLERPAGPPPRLDSNV